MLQSLAVTLQAVRAARLHQGQDRVRAIHVQLAIPRMEEPLRVLPIQGILQHNTYMHQI